MVQVDVFWSYSVGASFALAAGRQLERDHHGNEGNGGPLRSRFFLHTLLFLSLVFVPSGVCLLWAFPSWETMHAGDRNLPAWLVTAFAVTNVTQGILGFWVAGKLWLTGKRYLAFLQVFLGYFLMFFVLVHGWDGSGYQRFFSVTREDFLAWDWSKAFAWLTSPVAGTLGFFGAIFFPWMLGLMTAWLTEGGAASGKSRLRLGSSFLVLIFVYSLAPAVTASLLIRLIQGWSIPVLGWAVGGALGVLLTWLVLLRRGGLVHRFAEGLLVPAGKPV